MFAIFVTIDVRPEHVEEFAEASLGDARGSVRDEPGCFRFDINQDEEVPSRFYLYEVYRDEDAFQAHLEAPHFLEWRQKVQPFFDGDPQRIQMKTVFPSARGWEGQKSGLTTW